MKKLILLITMVLTNLIMVNAQTDTVMYIAEMHGEWHYICFNQHERAIVYAPNGCNSINWYINYSQQPLTDNPIILDGNLSDSYAITFQGVNCGQYSSLIAFVQPTTPEETTTTHWKHQYGPITLEAVGADSLEMYDFHWSTGETTSSIEVTAPGTYTCGISDQCATATRTFIVRDNVEIDLATCDLESNLNLVTWSTNPAQAQYIDHVIVKRDGLQVGTADYSDGQFTDNIGSGAASRTYTLTAIATDGTECPIVSYPKETIHMAYLTGINNTIEVNWNVPAGYDLLGYNICEWHPGAKDGDLTVIDFVGASVTSYTCSENQFNEGHVVVQGVENGKSESRLLSNRSEEGIVGIGEHLKQNFKIYPNPTTGTFTVEGASTLTVFNTLSQVIATSHEEDGTHTFTLRSGIYFIKSDEGVVKKVVVE